MHVHWSSTLNNEQCQLLSPFSMQSYGKYLDLLGFVRMSLRAEKRDWAMPFAKVSTAAGVKVLLDEFRMETPPHVSFPMVPRILPAFLACDFRVRWRLSTRLSVIHSYCKTANSRTPSVIHANHELWQIFDMIKELCESEIELSLLFRGTHPLVGQDSLISFPFRDPRTGLMETFPLSSRYERPTLAYLVGCVSKAIDWFFGLPALVDHQVCLAGRSNVDLGIHRLTRGLS